MNIYKLLFYIGVLAVLFSAIFIQEKSTTRVIIAVIGLIMAVIGFYKSKY